MKKYKTKFPVARIKKIMQADEDVGKMSQATPVLISKALELFLASLVQSTMEEAQKRGSKRVLAGHLKACIEGRETFDFLKDTVSTVPALVEVTVGASADGPVKAAGKGRKRAYVATAASPALVPAPLPQAMVVSPTNGHAHVAPVAFAPMGMAAPPPPPPPPAPEAMNRGFSIESLLSDSPPPMAIQEEVASPSASPMVPPPLPPPSVAASTVPEGREMRSRRKRIWEE